VFLDELAAFFETQSLGVRGSSLFVGHLPDTPDLVLVVYEYGGNPPLHGFGMSGLQYEEPAVQIVTRGVPKDYAEPRARIESAYRLLATVQGMTLSGTSYLFCAPQQSPFLFNRDQKDRVLFAVNAVCQKKLSA
jgi:hypothetical protein